MQSPPIEWINREIERQMEKRSIIDDRIRDLQKAKNLAIELPDTCPFCKGQVAYTEPPGSRGTRHCAETEKRAIEMARDVYKKEVEKMRLNQKLYDYYKKTYYTNLKAELLCDDTTKEWVADEVVDD